jgi:hypothetical protein
MTRMWNSAWLGVSLHHFPTWQPYTSQGRPAFRFEEDISLKKMA